LCVWGGDVEDLIRVYYLVRSECVEEELLNDTLYKIILLGETKKQFIGIWDECLFLFDYREKIIDKQLILLD